MPDRTYKDIAFQEFPISLEMSDWMERKHRSSIHQSLVAKIATAEKRGFKKILVPLDVIKELTRS